mgnify:CR=1 FL=1|tara:strand:- start:499 stop:1794 length:1296 start_codon:yes stop_codon:yes gene_type:complete
MKINYKITNTKTIFNYEVENVEELEGMGETKILRLLEKKGEVYFDYSLKNPHNDIIAYMGIIIFYPFIKHNLTFLFPLSDRFVTNLKKLPNFKNLKVNYKPSNYKKYQGKKNLIPIGGGLDSTSVMALYKDAYLYHQTGKEKVNCEEICKKLKMKEKPYVIDTNIKKFVDKPSYTNYICVFIGSLLIAIDNNVKYILLGTPLSGSSSRFRKNKFVYEPSNGSSTKTLIKNLGITFISPLIGCTELISSKIIVDNGLQDIIVFCDKDENNRKCNKCAKCFRKNLELYMHNVKYPNNYFNNYKDTQLEYFKKTKYKHIFLYKDYNFYKKILPQLANEIKKYNYSTKWCERIYYKLYTENEEEIYREILSKLKKYAKIMNEDDIFELENYDGNEYHKKIKEGFINVSKNSSTIDRLLKTVLTINIILIILLIIT